MEAYESLYKEKLLARDEVEKRVFELQRLTERLGGAESHILLAENEMGRLAEEVNRLQLLLSQSQQLILTL